MPGTLMTRPPLRLILLLLLAIIFNLIDSGVAIRCYKCAVTMEKMYVNNVTMVTHMCSKFDESDDFIVDCPYSTMCLKTISTLSLQNNQKQETITRGCAQQKDTTQVFKNRTWQHEYSVQEVYKEECAEFLKNDLAGSVKTHCYCRGNLCNAASGRSQAMSPLPALAVIFVLSATKPLAACRVLFH